MIHIIIIFIYHFYNKLLKLYLKKKIFKKKKIK